MKTSQEEISFKTVFAGYWKVLLDIDVDLGFWSRFLDISIIDYKKANSTNRWINQAILGCYNIDNQKKNWLASLSEFHEITIDDLERHGANFLNWTMNLAVSRGYNKCEKMEKKHTFAVHTVETNTKMS